MRKLIHPTLRAYPKLPQGEYACVSTATQQYATQQNLVQKSLVKSIQG